jgi:hypothetical protein
LSAGLGGSLACLSVSPSTLLSVFESFDERFGKLKKLNSALQHVSQRLGSVLIALLQHSFFIERQVQKLEVKLAM